MTLIKKNVIQKEVSVLSEWNTDQNFITLVCSSIKLFYFMLFFLIFIVTGKFALANEVSFVELSAQYRQALELFKDEQNLSDIKAGFKQIKLIAERGHSMAQYWLGRCYMEGWGTKKNPVAGFKWFEKSAEQGDIKGSYWTGLCYIVGDGTIRDIPKGCGYLRNVAKSEDSDVSLRAIMIYNRYCN